MAGLSSVYNAVSSLAKTADKGVSVMAGGAIKWGLLKPMKYLALGTAVTAAAPLALGIAAVGGLGILAAKAAWSPLGKKILGKAATGMADFAMGAIYGGGKMAKGLAEGTVHTGIHASQAVNKLAFRNVPGYADGGLKQGQFIGRKLRRGLGISGAIGVAGIGIAMGEVDNDIVTAEQAMQDLTMTRAKVPNSIDTMGADGNIVLASHKLRGG